MLDDSRTTPTDDADVQNLDINQEEETQEQPDVQEAESQVEETTEDDAYNRAWENIDTNEPPEALFGETNTQEEPVAQEPGSETEQVEPSNQEGLVISNPVLKHKGKEIPVESEDEMIRLAQQGLDYNIKSSKLNKLKPFQSLVDSGLSIEVAKAALDFINGNTDALDYLKKTAGYSEPENDNFFGYGEEKEEKKDKEYVPAIEQEDPVLDMFSTISEQDPELGGKINAIYSDIDDSFKLEVYNPQVFPAFVQSIKTGEFDKIYPHLIKAKAMNPTMPWLQAYRLVGEKINNGNSNPTEEKSVQPPAGTRVQHSSVPPKRNVGKLDYDSAFKMDIKELEERLFS